MCLKTVIISTFELFLCFYGIHSMWHPENSKNSHVIYPSGKPIELHLLRCQGFAVDYYSFTLDALNLQHSRLLQH